MANFEEGYAFGKVIQYRNRAKFDPDTRAVYKDGADCVSCNNHIAKGTEYAWIAGLPYCFDCATKAPKCVECSGRFFPKSHNAKTCSPECRMKYERRKNYERIQAYSGKVAQIQNELDSLKKEMETLTTFEFNEE